MTADRSLPELRPLHVQPVRHPDGRVFVELHDMLRISPQPLAVSAAAYFLMSKLDGVSTLADLQAAFRAEAGHDVPAEEVEQLVAVLDHYNMLETPRFATALAAHQEAYRAAPFRDNRAQGPSAEILREQITPLLSGTAARIAGGELRGLLAPHLDYARGAPCYTAAYSLLAQARPADRYVILGTNHFGRSTAAVATKKDFETPLGRVATDRAFVGRLEGRLGVDLSAGELDHLTEHSVELQVHILQVYRAEHAFEIVPILCPDVCGPTGTAPADGPGPDLADLADALGELVAGDSRRTVLIAGADFSHVGLSFGDQEPATAEALAEVERSDRRLLELFQAGDAEGLLSVLRATGNPTRICSTGSLYALRRALPARPCHLLAYHQAVDAATDTNVTCAAAAIL